MNKIIYALLTLAALTSCANSYNIQGSSDVQMLDQFTGTVDSTRMATLFMDDESIMPVVIERGEIVIKIDNSEQKVSGTPLNDKLTAFLEEYNQLQRKMEDLGHKQSQAIMDGEDENVTNARLNEEAARIADEEDKLVTGFIEENFDNVLGPGVFFMLTAADRTPLLSPWVEALMSKATDNFKNDAYVKTYYETAKQNEAIMNGMAEPSGAPQTAPQAPLPQTPTPNQLAQPTDSAQ